MRHYFTIAFLFVLAAINAQTANDSILFWKTGNMIFKQSIKPADMDSITFRRPLKITATTNAQTANDSVLFWKTGKMIFKQSIKPADMDSITFRRPLKITASGETVVIGTQSWTTKNLNVSTYRDGTIIPQVQNVISWAALQTGAWCYYENKTANGTIYGKLYNWYAVAGIHDNDPNTPNKTLAPAGYHIPTAAEWMTLTTFLGGENLARSKMKATNLWVSKSGITNTNTTGFTGLPGGYCSDGAVFNDLGYTGVWWTATEDDKDYAWATILSYDDGYDIAGTSIKLYGLSVRCIVGEPVDENPETGNVNYAAITHLSGEQTINDLKVNVTSSASSTTNWCNFGPYWAGYTGDGFYEFTFKPAISGVKLDFGAINGVLAGGGIEEVQIYVNDVHYKVTDNFSANSCDNKAQINSNGNLTGSEIKIYGCKDLKIDGTINKLKIYNKHLSGWPGGVVFSLNIKK